MSKGKVGDIVEDPKTGRRYELVMLGDNDLIDGELVELTNEESQYCMEDLRKSMLAGCDPSKWFQQHSCNLRLRYCIAKLLRGKYPDLTRDRVTRDERRMLNTGSPIVIDLADAFLGRPSEIRIAAVETCAESKTKQDSHKPGSESQMQARRRAEELGYQVRDGNDIKKLSHEQQIALLEALQEDFGVQIYDHSEEKLATPPPYVGYFVYHLLVPETERESLHGVYPIAYWSTSEAWSKSMIEWLWNRPMPPLNDGLFKKYLMRSVDDFLSRANAMVSATYGINEAIRKRLVRARRERGEFIRVLAGDKNDPYIEQIKQTLASGKKWDSSKEEENPNNPKKRRRYIRATTRWGNYGNPPEISKLIEQRDKTNPITSKIKEDPELLRKFNDLSIRVGDMKPGGRMPNIGTKGQLEDYLRFCFDVAEGTLPMRSIIELVLVKCEALRPVSLAGVENRHSKFGNHTLEDASALEMERSSGNTSEE